MAAAGCCASRISIGRREVAGAAEGILRTLEQFGFEWDGAVTRQYDRAEHYEEALRSLRARNLNLRLLLQPRAIGR